MKYGYVYPGGSARQAAEMAAEAEQAGWDAFFVWDSVWGIDPWVSLAAAAVRTERICLGTMITPPSRRRPWKLAAETATLDQLSGGRLILSVGLGAIDTGFAEFGEVTDRRARAELLDESLAILTGLWQGQPFSFEGKHYSIRPLDSHLPPVTSLQQPRIPIWVVALWGSQKSMARALRYDGLLPNVRAADGSLGGKASPEDIAAMADYVRERRMAEAFDIVVEGQTPGEDPAAYAAAGATWWIEEQWQLAGKTSTEESVQAQVRARVRQGPPR